MRGPGQRRVELTLTGKRSFITQDWIDQAILLMRGQKVMLDSDLAKLYGVTTKRLNQQVKRNPDRFPKDFMFQLTPKEHQALRLQFATSKERRGGRRTAPMAFTECHPTAHDAAAAKAPADRFPRR